MHMTGFRGPLQFLFRSSAGVGMPEADGWLLGDIHIGHTRGGRCNQGYDRRGAHCIAVASAPDSPV